jgi:DNA-binding LytR/AlgR family response regulator
VPPDAELAVLAVDDERPALEDLVRLLKGSPLTARVEGVSSARDALLRVGAADWDALFLDVRMPGLDGLELARVLTRLARPPAIVFVSAYENAAVEAFELHALDYLMKPAGRARIEEALGRVAAARGDEVAAAAPPAPEAPVATVPDADVIAVDNLRGGGTRLLARASILYLQAHGDYVRIVADDGRFLLRARLSDLEQRWAPAGFVRVHRGYVANLRRAVEVRPLLNGTAVLRFATGAEIPISRRQVGELRRRLAV